MLKHTAASRYISTILVILYGVGILGLSISSWQSLFLLLVPVHLLITLTLLVLNHENPDRKFISWMIGVFAAGFLIEWAGVKTGVIFGSYTYGASLGPGIDSIPLMIGINWVILAYCCHDISGRIFQPGVLKSFTAAAAMTLLDYFIEPVASRLGMWSWHNDVIPVRNFAGWFIFSFLVFAATNLAGLKWRNPSSVILYLLMMVFFITLNLTLRG